MILSAYIHIPFCSHKCDFCDFAAFAGVSELEDQYCQIVCDEITERLTILNKKPRLNSVFYGGGTPGLIKPANLAKIHDTLFAQVDFSEEVEISLETTPQSITSEKARQWLAMGINRLSVGVQSLQDGELLAMGRDHSATEAIHGLFLANEAGFVNVNIDLMYGLPRQTKASWEVTLRQIVLLAEEANSIKHISAYALDLSSRSPLLQRFPLGSDVYPAEVEFLELYELLINMLHEAGFVQYEISNFSKPGFQSTHNLNYWNNCQYLAFGVGAHRYLDGWRTSNWRSLGKYMRDFLGNETNEFINETIRVREAMMLGLRKIEGIDMARFEREHGINILTHFGKCIEKLQDGDFISLTHGCLKLTRKGVPVSNSVIAEFI